MGHFLTHATIRLFGFLDRLPGFKQLFHAFDKWAADPPENRRLG